MAEDGNSQRLLKKLTNLESTVYELLSLKKSTPVLKEKLLQIDDLILDIPNDQKDLTQEWRNKVAIWWKKYAACNDNDGPSPGRNNGGTRGPFAPIGAERNGSFFDRNHNGISSSYGSRDSSRMYFGSNRSSSGFGGGSEYNRVNRSQNSNQNDTCQFASREEYLAERERVRENLCEEFSKICPLESGTTDIEALKGLFGSVRRARTMTHPFDAALKEEIFCYAYRKLSPEKREKFLDQYGSNRMLVNLANFLRGLVETISQDLEIFKSGSGQGVYQRVGGNSNNLQRSRPDEQIGSYGPTSGGDTYHMNNRGGGYQNGNDRTSASNAIIGPNQCRYCRQEGHRIADCPQKNSKLCYTCNQPGHTSKFCRNQDKLAMIMDNSLSK